jgi:hypothetical protein
MVTWQDPTHPSGVGSDRPNNKASSGNVHLTRQRKADAAISMRLSGATWTEIAQVVGYPTPRAALTATEKALVKRLDEEDKAKLRQLAGARLERLLRSIWNKAIDPDDPEQMSAVQRARELIDRHAKLFGLDAPTEIVVHNPTKTELESWVLKVMAAGVPQVEEEDIFDVEVITDDQPPAISA